MSTAMKILLRAATLAALAATTVSAVPAQAQWRGGYGYGIGYGHGWGGGYGRGYRRGGGDTFGNLLLGGIIGGGLVALATSRSRDRTVERVADLPPIAAPLPAPPIAPPGEYDRAPVGAYADAGSRGEAVDACTAAAEDGARARVTAITHVERDAQGWRIDGDVDDSAHRADRGRFTCASARGKVLDFQYRDGSIASR